jgi:hypothetical protein
MEAGKPGRPGQPGESGRGGAGGTGGRGGDPSGTGGQGGPGGTGGETRDQSSQRLGLGNRSRTRWVVLVWTVLVMAGLLGGGYLLASKTSDNSETTRAVCALKQNVARRGQQSNDFLHAHPNGVPGIARAVIVKSIHDTRQTNRALRGLKC